MAETGGSRAPGGRMAVVMEEAPEREVMEGMGVMVEVSLAATSAERWEE